MDNFLNQIYEVFPYTTFKLIDKIFLVQNIIKIIKEMKIYLVMLNFIYVFEL